MSGDACAPDPFNDLDLAMLVFIVLFAFLLAISAAGCPGARRFAHVADAGPVVVCAPDLGGTVDEPPADLASPPDFARPDLAPAAPDLVCIPRLWQACDTGHDGDQDDAPCDCGGQCYGCGFCSTSGDPCGGF